MARERDRERYRTAAGPCRVDGYGRPPHNKGVFRRWYADHSQQGLSVTHGSPRVRTAVLLQPQTPPPSVAVPRSLLLSDLIAQRCDAVDFDQEEFRERYVTDPTTYAEEQVEGRTDLCPWSLVRVLAYHV